MNGKNIVLDVNSGAVHIVDDVVFKILDFYEKNNIDEIVSELSVYNFSEASVREAFLEIEALKQQGLLYFNDEYAREYAQNMTKAQNDLPIVKALCLHIAHDCNLKCKYCFAEEGEYGGKRTLMSFSVGKAAIDFILQNSGNRQNLEIDFFGGEPLLAFDVVKEIVEYAKEQEKKYNKNFRFTLTTNGLLLDSEIIQYVNKNMENVVLSIDGRKEVNDNMRGSGTYDAILPGFLKVAESREKYYVRGTFTAENLDFKNDVLHLAELGFKQISVEPVVSDCNAPYSLKEQHLPFLFEQYEQLAKEMLEKDFNFFHFMVDLTGGPCITKRLTGCGAGSEYLAVTPEGDLYACHQFVGKDEFKMGNVYEGITNFEKRKLLKNLNVYANEQCKTCFAKFYCSGGCAANAYNINGDVLKPYEIGCELQRKRVECALMIKAARSDI